MDRPVVLCGLGRVGWRVFESVRAAGLDVIVIDTQIATHDPRLHGARAIKGDARRQEVLEQAGIKDAGGVVIVTGDDLVNISAALLIRRLNPTARIVVRMFNQNLLTRFGSAVKNTVALSVSALTAPLLALTAVCDDTLGVFKLSDGPRQISEFVVAASSHLAGQLLRAFLIENDLIAFALAPVGGSTPQFLLDVPLDRVLESGDRLVVCGPTPRLRPILERERGNLLPGVRWAGIIRRWLRTARRTLLEIDLSVKIATPILFLTILASTLVFRYGFETDWGEGLYQTVSLVATGSELHGEGRPQWAKVFLSILKLAGTALIAAFTAILTQYLIRARLGGALEVRRVPDGGHVVICGLGNVGFRLVDELTNMGERVVVIERVNDNSFVATCRRKGVPTFIGDATLAEVLRQAHAGAAKAVIAATSSELVNLEIALLVREINPELRVIVRLTDPQFAEAVREAADIRHAISVSALAAPAFTAALFGDRVQTLVTTVGRTLVVIEVVVDADESHLVGKSLRAMLLDYHMVLVGMAGHDIQNLRGYRLAVGDRLTVVAELPDLERLIRRKPFPTDHGVLLESFPITAKESLQTVIRALRHCTTEEAQTILNQVPCTLTEGLTAGEAQELIEQLHRERIQARSIRMS